MFKNKIVVEDKIGHETLEIMSTAKWYNHWLFDLIKKHLSGKILEVGTGIGNFTRLLTTRGDVYATDINKRYLQKLKQDPIYGVKYGYGDIEKGEIDFSQVKFDSIVCMNVLEHINDDISALRNMLKLLSPTGKLILLVPAFQFAFGTLDVELGHFRRYSIKELEAKLESVGFSIHKAKYLNLLGIFGWFISARLLRRKIIPRSQLKIFNLIGRPLMFLENYFNPPVGLSVILVAQRNKK